MEPITAPSAPTSVYLYYDRHDILIYVGITSRGVKRNLEHNETKDWWSFVASQNVEHYPSRPEALARERALIEKHNPPFNTHHNRAHAEVRDAYLRFRVANLDTKSLREAVIAMQRRIELDVHDLEDFDHLVLRTRLADAAIVGAIQWPDGVEQPRVFGVRSKKGYGRVVRRQNRGPLLMLHLSTTSNHPLLDAYAVIKFDAKQRLTVRNVHVRLDHSDVTYCDRKCPTAPATRWVRPDGEGAA